MRCWSVIHNLLTVLLSVSLAATPVMAAPAQETETVQTEVNRWDYRQIEAGEAWPETSGGQGVVVAVLDNGIDDSHPALQGKIANRFNLAGDEGVDSEQGHGTHVGGLIAASPDQTGNSGLAFNSRLLDVKVAANDGRTDAQKVTDGIIWAADHGARVINISLVIEEPYAPLEAAVEYAWKKGSVLVAAAGNNGLSRVVYPAGYAHVISVAATDRNDDLVTWSARGDWVDVAAPGVDINSTLPGGGYGDRNGTSFACALVSGEAALLMTLVEDLNQNGRLNDEVEDLILTRGDPVDGLNPQSVRVNLKAAVEAALP